MAVIIVVVLASSAVWVFFNFRTNTQACDSKLNNEIGVTNQQLCLQPLTIAVSSVNASEFVVPVLTIKPGEIGTMEILYHISASQVNHQGNKANLTEIDMPGAISVTTATENRSKVGFSNGTLIFRDMNWAIYKYTVDTAGDSPGYYAIIPPFYYGFYPPLVVTSNPNKLNNSALSMWGFTGIIQSGEFIIPSTIIGVTGFRIVNDTIQTISYCPNSACVLITRSLA